MDSKAHPNVTVRAKGKAVQPLVDGLTEDKLRQIFNQELDETLSSTIKNIMLEQLQPIQSQFNELCESMAFFNKQFEAMRSELETKVKIINDLEHDNTKLKSSVNELTNRLNIIEQNMRDCNVEINGLPEHRSENLISTFEQLIKTVNVSIDGKDILHATRVAKLNKSQDRPRTVVVKMRTPLQRDSVLAAVSQFNKSHKDEKLSSRHLGYGGSPKPVFVSEHLSPSNKSLHAATRKKAKEFNYKFTWVRNGRIFVRKDEFSESHLIRSVDSLSLIK